jgi:hypothetical protein
MWTPVDDFGFILRYQEARKLPWSLLEPLGSPRKGQDPGRVTPWKALSLPHMQLCLLCAFRQASLESLPAVFTIKLLAETSRTLFPLYMVAATLQVKFGLARLTSLAEYKHSARKHLWSRGMHTSLATRPKPRVSTYECGLTNLSTS